MNMEAISSFPPIGNKHYVPETILSIFHRLSHLFLVIAQTLWGRAIYKAEQLNDTETVTQLIRSRGKIGTQAIWPQGPHS